MDHRARQLSCSGLLDRRGRLLAGAASIKVDQSPSITGVGTAFASYHGRDFVEACGRSVQALLGPGLFEIELLQSATDAPPLVIDVNARVFGQIDIQTKRQFRAITMECTEQALTPIVNLLTSKYLNGTPENSRATQDKSLDPNMLSERAVSHLNKLNDIAQRRGRTRAQMAIAWVLRDERITSALTGASRAEQVIDCARAASPLSFTAEELDEIDSYATDENINLWAASSNA